MSEIVSIFNNSVEYNPVCYTYYNDVWNEESYVLWFETYINQSQALYGLREIKHSNSNITNRPDAQKWANSFLANKDYPVKRVTLELQEQGDIMETVPPLGLVAVRDSKLETVEVEEFRLNKFSYKMVEGGIAVSIPLGELKPDLADNIKMIEDKIETNKEL
jgi:hypothetical protein